MSSYHTKYLKQDFAILKVIGMALIAWVIPFAGPLIAIWRGIHNIVRKTRKQFWKEKQAIKKPDRRYNVGYRVEGYREVEKYELIPADEKMLKIYKIKGIVYVFAGVLGGVFHLVALNS